MEKDLISTVRYFLQFFYPPSLEDIHLFFPKKITKDSLKEKLIGFEKKNKIITRKIGGENRYTLEGYSILFKKYTARTRNTKSKLQLIQRFISTLSWFPQIKLIGLSGSLAMMNAKFTDDIDLFIITERKRLWTGRFIAVAMAQFLGLRRKRGIKRAPDKICLNLFFDANDVVIPPSKRSTYVAHEVLQMKPLVNKNQTYEQFIQKNRWVFDLFPNSIDRVRDRKKSVNCEALRVKGFIGDIVEKMLKKVQMYWITKHRTTELITQTQLWFHPDDFEKKVMV